MSEAQLVAFTEVKERFSKSEGEMLAILRMAGTHGFTPTEVYELTVRGISRTGEVLTDRQKFQRMQAIQRTLSDLYYGQIPIPDEGKEYKCRRVERILRPEESGESFHIVIPPSEPIERHSEERVRLLKEEVAELTKQRDEAVAEYQRLWSYISELTSPAKVG